MTQTYTNEQGWMDDYSAIYTGRDLPIFLKSTIEIHVKILTYQ